MFKGVANGSLSGSMGRNIYGYGPGSNLPDPELGSRPVSDFLLEPELGSRPEYSDNRIPICNPSYNLDLLKGFYFIHNANPP